MDDKLHEETGEAYAHLADEALETQRPDASRILTSGSTLGLTRRRQLQVGDVVNVENTAYRVTSILSRGRLMVRPAGSSVARLGTEGRQARAALASDLRRAADRAIQASENLEMTPKFVVDVLLPAILGGD